MLTKQQENLVKNLNSPDVQAAIAAAMGNTAGATLSPEQAQAAEMATNIVAQLGATPATDADKRQALYGFGLGFGVDALEKKIEDNETADKDFKEVSETADWMARQNRCYSSQALAWADSKHILGDVINVIKVAGVVGGVIFLAKLIYDLLT